MIITITDDDARLMFLDFHEIYKSYNVRPSLGVVTDWADSTFGQNSDGSFFKCLSKKQLKDLSSEGFELLNHTKTHSRKIFASSGAGLNKKAAEYELSKSVEWFLKNGFSPPSALVYPFGNFSSDKLGIIKREAEKHFSFALNSSEGDFSDPYNLPRIWLSDKTIGSAVSKINNASENAWLIFVTHSRFDNIDRFSPNTLLTFLECAKKNDALILPFGEAVKAIRR